MKEHFPKKTTRQDLLFAYFRGFLKGLAILAGYFLIIVIYALVLVQLNHLSLEEIEKVMDRRYLFLIWLFGFFILYTLVYKYKLMRGWLMAGVLLTVYVIPFIMGDLELQKKLRS